MGTKRWVAALVVGLTPLLLIACNKDDNNMSASEAEGALCQDLTTLRAPIDQLHSLDPATASIGDVKKIVTEFTNGMKSLDEAAAKVREARVSDFQASVENLKSEVRNIGNSTTLQEAKTTTKAAVDGVRSAWTEAVDGLGCKK